MKRLDEKSDITSKQQKLIAFLLTERTIEQACEKAGVNVTTYWRWMQSDSFLKEYRKTRRGMIENAVAKLQSVIHQAIETLERNLNCENPSTEIRAAQIILEQSFKGIEILELETRLEAVEHILVFPKENPYERR